MKLTDKDIVGFSELWEREMGKPITNEQAREYAENLLGLVQIVIEPQLHNREEPP